MELRTYQQDCKDKIFTNWSNNILRQLAVMPTGAGKTILFAAIALEFVSKNQSVLVVAHREELITQAASHLSRIIGIEVGILKAGFKPTNSLVQVGSIQTLSRRKNYPKADLLVIDECHHAASLSYRHLIEQYQGVKILGLTATPRRIDGYGFTDMFDEMVIGVTPRRLIAEGYLCKYKLYGGFASLGLAVPEGRDYTAKELQRAVTKITPEDVVRRWQEFCQGRKTIVFAINVAHSQEITAQFQLQGISCEHLDGETPCLHRRDILERFRIGETLVISNCGILTEGFDCPNIEAVQCARPTTSVSLWLQILGRALRPAEGKEYAILLDHTDNWKRLGKPDATRKWSLAPISVDGESPGLRSCKECHHVFSPMDGLVNTRVIWIEGEEDFVTIFYTSCPACTEEVCWREPKEGAALGDLGQDPETIDIEIEFCQIPPDCRLDLLEQIGKIRKSGGRLKKRAKRLLMWKRQLIELVKQKTAINLSEIEVALDVLEIEQSAQDFLKLALGQELIERTQTHQWESIEELMSDRPQEIKRIVWNILDATQQEHIRKLKTLANTRAEELVVVRKDAPPDVISFGNSLWLECLNQVIFLLSRRALIQQMVAPVGLSKSKRALVVFCKKLWLSRILSDFVSNFKEIQRFYAAKGFPIERIWIVPVEHGVNVL